MNSRRQHFLDLCVVILFCIGISWHGELVQPVATAQSTVRTLSTEQADMAAHAVGGTWHNPATSPQVVDFGGVNNDQPAAGMDQWLAAQGQQVVAPRSDVVGD